MPPSRTSLLEIIEETYGTKHPDFEAIRSRYEQIIESSDRKSKEKDTKLLLAGLYVVEHTLEDWGELNRYERENALKAIKRVRKFTGLLLEKHGSEGS